MHGNAGSLFAPWRTNFPKIDLFFCLFIAIRGIMCSTVPRQLLQHLGVVVMSPWAFGNASHTELPSNIVADAIQWGVVNNQ